MSVCLLWGVVVLWVVMWAHDMGESGCDYVFLIPFITSL